MVVVTNGVVLLLLLVVGTGVVVLDVVRSGVVLDELVVITGVDELDEVGLGVVLDVFTGQIETISEHCEPVTPLHVCGQLTQA